MRDILRSDPQILGPPGLPIGERVVKKDQPRKRPAQQSENLEMVAPFSKRSKYSEVIDMLEDAAQDGINSTDLQMAQQRLLSLQRQLEQAKAALKVAEEVVDEKMAQKKRLEMITKIIKSTPKQILKMEIVQIQDLE